MCEVDRAIPNTEAWYLMHVGAFEDLVHDHAHDKRSGKCHLENEELRPFLRHDRTVSTGHELANGLVRGVCEWDHVLKVRGLQLRLFTDVLKLAGTFDEREVANHGVAWAAILDDRVVASHGIEVR